MKFTVERSKFLEAVSRLQKVVGAKTSMPVLEGILISAEQGKVTMIAYDLEKGMKKEIYASCSEAGDIVINARLLSDILRKMVGVQVEIEADDRLMCHIRSGEAVFDIMGMSANDFPEMPSVADGEKLSIEGKTFCEMVKGTIFAVSQIEGTRPILTGLNISVKDGILQMVGIDGFRLGIRRQKTDITANTEFVVSGKSINEVVRLVEENTENIDIIVGSRLISFDINGYIFISRLLDGEFVNFEKIIPDEFVQKVKIDCSDFTGSVERVSLLINDSFNIPIRFSFNEEEVVLSCATSMGRATENFGLALEGEPFEIGLNSRYLLDALHACDSGKITIRFNGPNSGVLIKPENDDDIDFLYLIMPMRMK